MPSRTPFFGSLCFAKNSLSCSASDSKSRSSPPTTIPSCSGSRASWRSCGEPLFCTRAAAIWEAPILRPTTVCFARLACLGGFEAFGAFAAFAGLGPPLASFGLRESSSFQNGVLSDLSFGAFSASIRSSASSASSMLISPTASSIALTIVRSMCGHRLNA